MKWIVPYIFVGMVLGGCGSSSEPPALSSRVELKPNVGEVVRVEGTARYLKVGGPSVATEGFEIRVYPRSVWGAELDGKKVVVVGRLNDSAHATPPDPSVNPGEYWLSESTWKPAVSEKKP